MVKKICQCCGKEYEVKKYRENTSRFCSRHCQGTYTCETVLSKVDKSYMIGNQLRKGKKPKNCFQIGHEPWNKGVKGLHLSPNTEFKKGNKPLTTCEVGTITTRCDKGGTLRNYIKVAEPNVWKYYYVFLIEQSGQIIPEGSVVHHINKNPLDDRIENLQILTRAEHINIHRNDLKSKPID